MMLLLICSSVLLYTVLYILYIQLAFWTVYKLSKKWIQLNCMQSFEILTEAAVQIAIIRMMQKSDLMMLSGRFWVIFSSAICVSVRFKGQRKNS